MKRRARESARRPSTVHGDMIMSMAVVTVYSQDDTFRYIESFVKDLRKRGIKTVDFYIYFDSKKTFEMYQGTLKDFPFSRKGFDWKGKFLSRELKHALEMDYDVLLDLTRGGTVPTDLLISKTQAKWKAGERINGREYLLDFMIDLKGGGDTRNLMHHLDTYISNFNLHSAA